MHPDDTQLRRNRTRIAIIAIALLAMGELIDIDLGGDHGRDVVEHSADSIARAAESAARAAERAALAAEAAAIEAETRAR